MQFVQYPVEKFINLRTLFYLSLLTDNTNLLNFQYMKRSTIYLVLILVSTLFLFDGCAKKTENKADNCATLSESVSNASSAWIAAFTAPENSRKVLPG
jgi:hypothetical protein